MRLNPDADQLELRDSVRNFLAKESPLDRVRAAVATEDGHDLEVWRRLTSELGIPALAVSEAGGGAGFGLAELCLALEEAGAALLPGPLLGSGVFAAQVLDAVGEREILPGVVAGQKTAALAVIPDLAVAGEADAPTLTGMAQPVVGDVDVDHVVVVGGSDTFVLPAGAAGLSITPLETLDLARRAVCVTLRDVEALRVGATQDAQVGLDRSRVALAAESLGVLRRSLELATDHARQREQFGRVIGSYQGIKHMLADVYADYELASATVAHAGWVADHEPENLSVATDLAAACVLPRAFNGAFQMIQTLGGIGFTWEHDAHLYFRRARSNESLLPGLRSATDRLADHVIGLADEGAAR